MATRYSDNGRGTPTQPQPGSTTTVTAREPSADTSRAGERTGGTSQGEWGQGASRGRTEGEGVLGRFHRAASERLGQARSGGWTAGHGGAEARSPDAGGWRGQEEGWRAEHQGGWSEGRAGRDYGVSRYETERDYRAGREDSGRGGWSDERSRFQEERAPSYTGRTASSQGWDAEGRGGEMRREEGGAQQRTRWQREPLTAREIMTRNPRGVRRDSPLRDAAQIMKDENCGIVPVVDERGRLVGVLTDRDIVVRAFTDNKTPDQFKVSDVMTDDVEAVTQDEDIHSLIDLMGRKQIRRVPVVEQDDRLVGIVAMSDLATRADYDQDLQDALERISSRRSFWSRFFS